MRGAFRADARRRRRGGVGGFWRHDNLCRRVQTVPFPLFDGDYDDHLNDEKDDALSPFLGYSLPEDGWPGNFSWLGCWHTSGIGTHRAGTTRRYSVDKALHILPLLTHNRRHAAGAVAWVPVQLELATLALERYTLCECVRLRHET